MPKKMTQEEYFKKVNEIHNWKYTYKSEYIGTNEDILVNCPIHGDFKIKAANHLYLKQGCKYCSHQSYPSTIDTFIEKTKKVHGNKYDYSKAIYVNNKTKIEIICPIHGSFFIRPNDHLNGHGCSKCAHEKNAKKQKFTKAKFEKLSRKIHGDKYIYEKVNYIDYETKVCIICPKHGEFWQTPDNHLHGHGCPSCSLSKLEESLATFLKEHNFNFNKQKTFDWLKYKGSLYLDFYLPKYNIAIECQGLQHYHPVDYFGGEKEFKKIVARDAVKKELCKKHGVKILYYTNEKIKEEKIFTNLKNLLLEIEDYGKQTTIN